MNTGLTEAQLHSFIEVLSVKVGEKQAQGANEVLAGLLAKIKQS